MRDPIALDIEASRRIRKDLLIVGAENNLAITTTAAARRRGTRPSCLSCSGFRRASGLCHHYVFRKCEHDRDTERNGFIHRPPAYRPRARTKCQNLPLHVNSCARFEDVSALNARILNQKPSSAKRHDTGQLGSANNSIKVLSPLAKGIGKLTERGRFELPRAFRPDRFSKPAHSTTLPPLRELAGILSVPPGGVKLDFTTEARRRYRPLARFGECSLLDEFHAKKRRCEELLFFSRRRIFGRLPFQDRHDIANNPAHVFHRSIRSRGNVWRQQHIVQSQQRKIL